MYSTDKAGTTVSVDRPRSERAEEQAAAGPAAPAMGPEERATVPAGTPILVVEDDPRVSRSTVGALEELGYTALACAGGREALDILAKHREIELRSEEHTSELQSLMRNSYAVFCLKKKKTT